MNSKLQNAFNDEMRMAIAAFQEKNFTSSFFHLERAHILGQSYIMPHVKSHWWMLKIGVQASNFKEVVGQAFRIVAALIFTKIWVPLGNTGGTNVNPLQPMPIPEDLREILGEEI